MRGIIKGLLLLTLVMGVALAGCARKSGETEVSKATSVMNPTEGSKVKGFVSFTKARNGLRIVADIQGLSPGLHGFHIHEYGDCSSPDAASAGGHFNPADMPHGGLTGDKRHAGDLGNIEADKSGRAKVDITVEGLGFAGPNSVIGRSIVVHAQADDFKTQPTGNSGARIACGVIGISK